LLDLERQIQDLNSRLSNIIRIGTVTSVKPEKQTARVVFSDRDETESYDLFVMVKNSKENKDDHMPDIDEEVLCLFLPIGIETGFVIGAYYSDENTPPASTNDKRITKYKDGTTISYDRENHALDINIPENGSVNITVNGPATIKAPTIDLGESNLQPMVLGDNLAAWITSKLKPWLDAHEHGGPPPATPFDPGNGASGGNVYSTKNKTQ
jgi:phage baseplate assembly protein V